MQPTMPGVYGCSGTLLTGIGYKVVCDTYRYSQALSSQESSFPMLTVISHENVTITRFSLLMLHGDLRSWSPWVPLNCILTPRIPAERF